MKKRFVLLLTVLIIQLTVFSQTNPLIKYLPDNASTVINFNAKALAAKIPAASFRQSFIYQEMMKDPKMPLNILLTAAEKSGIDFSAGIFVVITNDTIEKKSEGSVGSSQEPGFNIFIKLSNAALFTANMKEMLTEKDGTITMYGTDRIIQNGKDMTIGWNNDVLVITSATDKKIKQELNELYNDTTGQRNYKTTYDQISYKLKNAQRNICFSLLTPKSQNLLINNSQFITVMNTAADITSWNNGLSSPLGNNKIIGMLGSGLSRLQGFTGKSNTSVVNFENGKIVMQSNRYPNDEVAAIYKKYPATPVNTDLSRRLPKGKILGLINTSYHPQMITDLLQKSGVTEMLEELKKPIPFDINAISSAFGGNMLMAVIKSDEIESADSLTRSMDGIKLIVAMPIANKVKFDELKVSLKQVWDSMQQAEDGSKMMKGMKPVVKYTDSLFVLSLSPDVATAFINNAGTGTAPEWLQSKSQYPMVMQINMKEIIEMVIGKKRSAKNAEEEQMIINMFDQMVLYGGNYENESLTANMEFQFSNKNDNALKQLFDMINLVAGKKGQQVNEEAATTDNIKVEEVTIQEVVDEEIKEPPPPKPIKKATLKPKAKAKVKGQ
jgi:Domain of unknown function (DUF4836)